MLMMGDMLGSLSFRLSVPQYSIMWAAVSWREGQSSGGWSQDGLSHKLNLSAPVFQAVNEG